jgi:hypothetical protein
MSGKPTIPKVIIRRKVREVLAIRPGYGQTEKQLLEFVNELTGGGVSLDELREAIEWNTGEKLIRSSYDAESEQTLIFITSDGIAKQNIK